MNNEVILSNQIAGAINKEISDNIFGAMLYGEEYLKEKYKSPYYFDEKCNETGWRTDEPPKDVSIQLLCVLFDDDECRKLQPFSWDKDKYNRNIFIGSWNGEYFTAGYNHSSGDPWYQVVAWKPVEKQDLGKEFYTHCIGEARPW